jgi:hypothetical protein
MMVVQRATELSRGLEVYVCVCVCMSVYGACVCMWTGVCGWRACGGDDLQLYCSGTLEAGGHLSGNGGG